MGEMSSTCSQCDDEATASVLQEPLCEQHAQERLEELEDKKEEREAKFEEAKQKYEDLLDKYNVSSYGQIEHQLTVEGRDDIDESDVEKVSDAEDKLASTRQNLKGVEEKISDLKRSM